MVAGVRAALRRKVRRVLLQAPTGSGKTVIASFIASEVASRGKRVSFNVHRAELMRGTSNTFTKYGIKHGFIAADHPLTVANVQICSIDTLKNRLTVTAEPDVVLWDECIVGDSLIYTDVGAVRIEDVPNSGASLVLSHDGENTVWAKINGWRLTGSKQTLLVKMSSGKVIRGTSNHPIYTARGWVSIGEIIPGDQVLCLSQWSESGFSELFSATHQYRGQTQGQSHLGFTPTTPRSNQSGLSTRRDAYSGSVQKSILSKIKGSALNSFACGLHACLALTKFMNLQGRTVQSNRAATGLMHLARKALRGGTATTEICCDQHLMQHSTQRDSVRKGQQQSPIGFAQNTERPTSINTAGVTSTSGCQGLQPNQCSKISGGISRSACVTSWETVTSVTLSEELPVFDISVEGTHRFFANGILVHNCHHLGAAGWQEIMNAWPNATHIGLSATPWRLDGSGLDDCFDELIPGPSTSWLMDEGHLSQYEIYAPTSPDMKGARKSKGRAGPEFTKGDASARMDIPKRTGDIIKHWRLHANGMRTIGFAVSVADSMMLVERFNAAGIPAAHLDGTTPKGLRKKIIDGFVDGTIKVLFNVALFDEGFDLAAIAGRDVTVDCLIDAAPTMSLSRVLQRWGRVLRPKPYAAIILDHAGNSARHGFPDDERVWTLEGRDKTAAANDNGPPPPVTCTGCFRQIKRPLPDCCPSCGKPLLAEFKPLDVAEGELKKVTAEDREKARQARKMEEHNARTLVELVALGQRRGYPNPHAWAFKKWSNSKARQRHAKQIADADEIAA
ncbi:putative DNA helicase [Xanthomonas phage FoX3]|uniref:Putative DNA helicase n=1 Tax=Xanthomonas phage FoX3 TaxID=2723899 RepID=A0A858NNU1_9CAUD|nr:head morphogenesis [Xanthomonas phage FoX3]QJB21940.1 putative DNA helicase [Xanthomonas phage FoX3]